jgi:hypothetical protein
MNYEDFMTKVKQNTSGHLGLEELLKYISSTPHAELYLIVHGTSALAKLDVSVVSFEPQHEATELRDIDMQCTMYDGRFFSILASTMTPSRFPEKGPANYSRIFSSKEARDVFFDGLAYRFEVEEERALVQAQKHQDQFIAWLSKRLGPKSK